MNQDSTAPLVEFRRGVSRDILNKIGGTIDRRRRRRRHTHLLNGAPGLLLPLTAAQLQGAVDVGLAVVRAQDEQPVMRERTCYTTGFLVNHV